MNSSEFLSEAKEVLERINYFNRFSGSLGNPLLKLLNGYEERLEVINQVKRMKDLLEIT